MPLFKKFAATMLKSVVMANFLFLFKMEIILRNKTKEANCIKKEKEKIKNDFQNWEQALIA